MMIVERPGYVTNRKLVVLVAMLSLILVGGTAAFALILTLHVPDVAAKT